MADSGWGEAYFLPGCFDLSLRLEADRQRWWRKAPSKNESLHCKPASPNCPTRLTAARQAAAVHRRRCAGVVEFHGLRWQAAPDRRRVNA